VRSLKPSAVPAAHTQALRDAAALFWHSRCCPGAAVKVRRGWARREGARACAMDILAKLVGQHEAQALDAQALETLRAELSAMEVNILLL
jgi:hypothetical protein